MTITFNQTYRQSLLTNIASAAAGVVFYPYTYAVPQLVLYSGTAPTDADTVLSANTVLASVPFQASTPAFGAPTAAKPSVITANTMQTQNAFTGSGTACNFYRTHAATAAAVNGSTVVTGQVVMIATAAGSTWTGFGADANTTGHVFVATGAGSGTGTCYIMGTASGAGMCVEQGTVGTSGQDLVLNSNLITAGGPVQITSFTRQL